MSGNNSEIKYGELLKYVAQNKNISIPQLQAECELTYSEALEIMKRLEADHLVASNTDSIEREVDTRRANAAELDMNECFSLYTSETAELFEFVFVLHDGIKDPSITLHGDAEMYADLYARAEALGLAHTFDGHWYPSVSDKTIERLKSILNEGNDLLAAAIAMPVFKACIEGRLDDKKILECCLLPDFCRMLIENWLERYRENGYMPHDDKHTLLSFAQRNEVADAVFNAYIIKYDCTTKWEYVGQAKQALEMLIDDPAVPLYFKLAAKEVVRRLEADYDGESLMRLRKKLTAGEDENECEEDEYYNVDDLLKKLIDDLDDDLDDDDDDDNG